MTRANSRVGGIKGAVAAFAVLCAAGALVILATASPVGGPSTPVRSAGAGSLEQGPLAR